MDSGGFTRRSLIAAIAAGGASGALRPRVALARLLAPEPSATVAGLSLVNSGLQAGPGQPPIVAREVWAQGRAHPRVSPEYGAVELAFVHHTENPNGYTPAEVPAMLRSIYDYHRYTHGWNDIGYNFVIDRFGRIFEARAGGIDEPVIGAHAGGYNAYSTGIAMLGTYISQPISAAARVALEHLLAWKLSLHGAPTAGHVTVRVTAAGAVYSRFPAHAPVTLPRIAGHRDADSTDCPGDALYGELHSLRTSALPLAGQVANATLAFDPAGAGGTPLLNGSVQLLSGASLSAAPVAIQLRTVARKGELVSEHTLAQTLTDSDGRFSLPLVVAPAASRAGALRAVCLGAPGVPVVASAPLSIAGALSFSPSSAPAQAPVPTPPNVPPQAV